MSSVDAPGEIMPSERQIVVAVWPALVASAVGLLPFTVFTTYLVVVAADAGGDVAGLGSLRSLAGIGAVLAGVALAPLVGRFAPGRVAAAMLGLLAVGALVGSVAQIPTLAAFCLLTGMSNALLYPALSAAAADRFGSGPAAGRAATLVMSAQTLAATLGAPLVALPTLWWGWQGDLVAIAVLALVLVPVLLRFDRGGPPAEGRRLGYVASFQTLARVRGARALLVVSFARAGAFMGHLALLAALYDHRFGLTASVFAFVYALSGGAFFLGHLIAGRLLSLDQSERRAHRCMAISLVTALFALAGVYLAPALPLALMFTAALSASHAVVAAAVVTLLVRRCGDVRGAALSLNAAGMSLGLTLGAAGAGAGLAIGGYAASAAVVGALTVLALLAAVSPRPAVPPTQTEELPTR